jgi:DNA-binding response OmpR family regulator
MSTNEASPAPWRFALRAPPVHSPPRILLAEDDGDMRRLIGEALRKDGYEVIEVGDGGRLLVRLAHEFADEGGPDLADLLVSDVRMPVCSGMQILEQMRAVRWKTPVILMTAFGDAATRQRALSYGALLLDKPFDVDDLRTAIACMLRRESPSDP